MRNAWCEVLGIDDPDLDEVKDHPEANTYAKLIVALLERGEPMTLVDVADRFELAGVTSAERALLSLKRCKPARPPVYRDGDLYSLDPHDDDLDLWAFTLGLRPAKVPSLRVVQPAPEPLPGPDVPVTSAELEEAWSDASLATWSARRMVLAVLDAHDRPMRPGEVIDFVSACTRWHHLGPTSGQFGRKRSGVDVLPDGRWALASDAWDGLVSMRKAVRERVEAQRRWARQAPDPAVVQANIRASERRRAACAAQFARMRRVLLYAFPARSPEVLGLLDVGERELATFVGDEIQEAVGRLDAYGIIGAMDVRALLRSLDYPPGEHRLAELGPPQKTKKLNKRGRTLRITVEMLITGSCGISHPFGNTRKLRSYLRDGKEARLRRRVEASLKSLHAMYAYGRLHGALRLRWGFLDEMIPVPWVDRAEDRLYELKKVALDKDAPLEVVVGSAPGWTTPWARGRLAFVEEEPDSWWTWLVDEYGHVLDDRDVQLARLHGEEVES